MPRTTDSFTYSDGNLATLSSGKWENVRNVIEVVSGEITGQSDGSWNIARIATLFQTYGTDQDAEFRVVNQITFEQHGPGVFVSGDGLDLYWLRVRGSGQTVDICRVNGLTVTVLSTRSGSVTGQRLRLRGTVAGATVELRVYADGAQLTDFSGMTGGAFIDSSVDRLTSGQVGTASWGTGVFLDDFEGGDADTSRIVDVGMILQVRRLRLG